jgi:hypothetical protein
VRIRAVEFRLGEMLVSRPRLARRGRDALRVSAERPFSRRSRSRLRSSQELGATAAICFAVTPYRISSGEGIFPASPRGDEAGE